MVPYPLPRIAFHQPRSAKDSGQISASHEMGVWYLLSKYLVHHAHQLNIILAKCCGQGAHVNILIGVNAKYHLFVGESLLTYLHCNVFYEYS